MSRSSPLCSFPAGVLALALLALPASASAAPADAERLRALATLVEAQGTASSPSAATVTTAFTAELLTRTKEIAAQNGLPASIGLDGADFGKQLKARVEGPVKKALAMPRGERTRELYTLLAEITQQEEAHNQLAAWLKAEPMSTYAKTATDTAEAARVAALEAERKKAAEARGDRPLTDAERIEEARLQALESARADKAVLGQRLEERFRRTVWAVQGEGDLRLLPNESVLVDDRGGPGTRNGIADAGEWVTISLPIVNAGRTPWFSSSAYVRTDNECVWTGASTEVELPELAPGGKAAVELRFYLSEQCADRTRLAFNVEVRDTQRTVLRPVNLGFGVLVSNVGPGNLRDTRIDRDEPGFSEVSAGANMLAPNDELEVSAGFVTGRPGALQALQAWGWSTDVRPALADAEFKVGTPMLPAATSAGAAFDPHDDVDVRVVDEDALERVTSRIADVRGWRSATDAGGVAVVETVVSYAGPEGDWAPAAKARVEPKPPEPPKPPPAPSADETLSLLKKFVSVEARDVPAETGALASATSTVFDARIDEEAFRLAWCRATTVRAPGEPDPCDPNACPPEAPAEVKPIEVPTPAFSVPAAYTFRHYVWFGEQWQPGTVAPPEPEPVVEEPVEEPTVEPEPEPPPAPKPERELYPLMVAVGVELGGSAVRADTVLGIERAAASISEPHLFAEFAYGERARFHLRGAYSLGADSALARNDQSASALYAGLGGGYAVPLGSFEVEPLALVGARLASVQGDFTDGSGSVGLMAIFVEPGLTARWYVTPHVGLFGAVDYRLEVASTPFGGLTSRILDNSGVKLQLGVSAHF